MAKLQELNIEIQQSLNDNDDIEMNTIKKSTEIDVFLQDSIDYTFMTSLINFEHFKYLLSKLIMSPLWVFKTPAPVISEYPGMPETPAEPTPEVMTPSPSVDVLDAPKEGDGKKKEKERPYSAPKKNAAEKKAEAEFIVQFELARKEKAATAAAALIEAEKQIQEKLATEEAEIVRLEEIMSKEQILITRLNKWLKYISMDLSNMSLDIPE